MNHHALIAQEGAFIGSIVYHGFKDELFTRETGFISLDKTLKCIHKNKSEVLLVLKRPYIPLYNNLSECDIREYFKERK